MLCKSIMLGKDWIYKEPKSRTSAVTLQTTRRLCVAYSRVVGDLVVIRFRDSVRFGQFAKTSRSGIVRSFSRVSGSGESNHGMHSSQTQRLPRSHSQTSTLQLQPNAAGWGCS